MKTLFTAKYLQHLTKKNKDGGFTLIELLVVIIIVGVLAAIALPSFLNQIGKARGSEAKATLGTINRAQQAYRLENSNFASEVSYLDSKVTAKFYTYDVVTSNATYAEHSAEGQGATEADLKNYASAVAQSADGNTFNQVVCETDDNDAAVPNIVEAAAPVCPGASKPID